VTADRRAVRLSIRGRVQAVGYRAWAVAQARALGLSGWVRNRLDGRVELLAAGPAQEIEMIIAACRTGPPLARVDDIEVVEAIGIVARGFSAKPTV
jgi:acylphosphatase